MNLVTQGFIKAFQTITGNQHSRQKLSKLLLPYFHLKSKPSFLYSFSFKIKRQKIYTKNFPIPSLAKPKFYMPPLKPPHWIFKIFAKQTDFNPSQKSSTFSSPK